MKRFQCLSPWLLVGDEWRPQILDDYPSLYELQNGWGDIADQRNATQQLTGITLGVVVCDDATYAAIDADENYTIMPGTVEDV